MIIRKNGTPSAHDEGGHYWISISDLMTSLLFIFIIILAYTFFTFKQKSDAFEANANARSELLKILQADLNKSSINVDIDPENGNMRVKADTFFASGSAIPSEEGKRKLIEIAKQIKEKITTTPKYKKAIDTIFIEGHTDSKPLSQSLGGRSWRNLELSSQRAINSFEEMNNTVGIAQMKNSSGKFLFSYSGYADMRPIPGLENNTSQEAMEKNRRIEFFFALSSSERQK